MTLPESYKCRFCKARFAIGTDLVPSSDAIDAFLDKYKAHLEQQHPENWVVINGGMTPLEGIPA